MRLAHAAAYCQPRRKRKLVFDEDRFDVSADKFPICKWWIRAVVEKHAEELTIVLPETIEPSLDRVSSHRGADGGLSANVVRGPVIGDSVRKIEIGTIVVRRIEVIER